MSVLIVRQGKKLQYCSITTLECLTRCTRYNDLDAAKILNKDTGVFQCEHCNVELKELSSAENVDRSQARRTQLAQQLKPIVEQLKRTDGIAIPKYLFLKFMQQLIFVKSQELKSL